MTDKEYMQMALKLAEKGSGYTSPNPLVGAVIVKHGKVIGSGYHERCGESHAERNALAGCEEPTDGATLYVTLEPCCHYGRTPPCTEAIIASGISRVVVGTIDPNPLIGGKGIRILDDHGIEVTSGVLQKECDRLNAVFFHFIRYKMPYVIMKYAMTMDGKIAAGNGESKWITGEAARENVHRDRHRYSGIMVGVGTVIKDNPSLDCRLEDGNNPIRIICDTNLRTPADARVVTTAKEIPTILVTAIQDEKQHAVYLKSGCEVLVIPTAEGRINLKQLMVRLGEKEIDSIFLEGGSTLNWSALESGIVHRVQAYIAPKLFGGSAAISPIGGQGVPCPNQAIKLVETEVKQFGEDLLLESEVEYVHGNY